MSVPPTWPQTLDYFGTPQCAPRRGGVSLPVEDPADLLLSLSGTEVQNSPAVNFSGTVAGSLRRR